MVEITPKGTNITGKYRECEENNCKTLVPCPFNKCKEHWIAISDRRQWNIKDVKQNTEAFI